MKKHNSNVRVKWRLLLRQQRYLYHQLKILINRQRQLTGTNSPEPLLEVISDWRELAKKLKRLLAKFRQLPHLKQLRTCRYARIGKLMGFSLETQPGFLSPPSRGQRVAKWAPSQ